MKSVCIGRLVLDILVYKASQIPPRFSPLEVENIDLAPGGGAFLSARMLRRLGHDAIVFGEVGADPAGHLLKKFFREDAGGLSGVWSGSGTDKLTSKSVVAIDTDGSARYLLFRGADALLDFARLEELIETHDPANIHIANATQFIPRQERELVRFLKMVRHRRPEILVTADMDKEQSLAKSIWRVSEFFDLLFGNEMEFIHATSATNRRNILLQDELHTTRRGVVVKMGHLGCVVVTATGQEFVSAYHTGASRSENGAGDTFCGAFIHGLLNDWSLSDCAEFANVVAGLFVAGHLPEGQIALSNLTTIKINASRPRFSEATFKEVFRPSSNSAIHGQSVASMSTPESIDTLSHLIRSHSDLHGTSVLLAAGNCISGIAEKIAATLQNRVIAVGPSVEEGIINHVHWYDVVLDKLDSKLGKDFGRIDAIFLSEVLSGPGIHAASRTLLPCMRNALKVGGTLILQQITSDQLRHLVKIWDPADSDSLIQSYFSLAEVVSLLEESRFRVRTVLISSHTERMSTEQYVQYLCAAEHWWMRLHDGRPDAVSWFESRLKHALRSGDSSAQRIAPYYVVADRL